METDPGSSPPKSVNSNLLMQCLNKLDEHQYSMVIDCGISEPTCLVWGTAAGGEDAEGNVHMC